MNRKRHGELRFLHGEKKSGFKGKKPIVEKSAGTGHSRDDLLALLSREVYEYPFSVRAANAMQNLNIVRVADLALITRKTILKQKNCGEKTVQEMQGFMEGLGLSIGMELDEVTARRFRKLAEDERKAREKPMTEEERKRSEESQWFMGFAMELVARTERLPIIAREIESLEQMDDIVRRKAIPIRDVYEMVLNKEPVTDEGSERRKSEARSALDSLAKTKNVSPQTIKSLREFIDSITPLEEL